MRHVERQADCLGAVFDESWRALNRQIVKAVSAAADASAGKETLLATALTGERADPRQCPPLSRALDASLPAA
jgi:hypothetical protein